MDLSTALDTLYHAIPIHKLQYYGISGTAINSSQSYLNRQGPVQYLEIKSISSTIGIITTGVPDGSIQSALLFHIYI